MKLYGGIDPHSNSSVVALLDADDQVVYRQRLSNDAAEIVAALAPFRRPRWERRPSHSIHVRSARKRKMANAWCEMESGHAPFSSPLTPHLQWSELSVSTATLGRVGRCRCMELLTDA
jgi:hypothetical protein